MITNLPENIKGEIIKNDPLIELKGISKSFGNTVILDNIDLKIYRGEALVIIGPSGTGKSTVLRLIAGLLAPDQGEIYIDGQKRIGLVEDGEDPIGISMVFQQSALFDSLTVRENVGFLLYQHSKLSRKEIRALVEESLEKVGLKGLGDRLPAELSGGMRKRVSFARAIMAHPHDTRLNPEVILYDEPTAGLDPIASTVIENLVRQLKQSTGVCSTYIMVTHQDSTIRNTAEKIIFLYGGKIMWEGKVEDLENIDNIENDYVRQFFQARIDGPIRVVD
jgi:phospholipid/cholesterol/gamma-HCH transport system ATP-binding protein